VISRSERRGFALIEVLVGIALLATTSAGLVALLIQCGDSLRRARRAEREVTSAAEALTRVSLWTQDRLESNAGLVRIGGVTLRITVASMGLFEVVAFRDDGVPVLNTTFYRAANAP
jgi:prepilin-type N-terminal cleavage/methylation domain-containing protein